MSIPSSSSRPATGRSFFEAPIPLALLTFDVAALILEANEPFARMMGQDRSDLLGRSLCDLVPAADTDALVAKLAPLVAGGADLVEDVAQFIRPDASTCWARLFAKRFTGDDARPCLILDLIDIDEEVRAREELRASEERYRLIVHLAREGIWTIDADGFTSFANEQMAAMLGYEPSEMVGRRYLDFIHPDERGEAGDNLDRRRRGIAEQVVRKLQKRDGGAVWALTSTGPIVDDDGQFVGAVAMVSDVTEARHAQMALEASEGRLSALLEHSWDIIAVLDADGTVRSVSSAVSRIFGFAPAGERGLSGVYDLVLDEDMPALAEALRETADGTRGPDTPVRFRARTPQGAVRMFEAVTQNLLDDPTIRGIVVNSRDITDRVRSDEALHEHARQLAELSAASQQQRLEVELQRARRLETIGRLVGGVAHDFNNLLGVITNYAEVLASDPALGAEAERDIDAIRLATERGSLLVRRLLRLGGDESTEPETFDLNALLGELLALAGRALGTVSVRFTPDREACWVCTRRSELEQVVLNLLLNARDASGEGDVVEVATARGWLDRRTAGSDGAAVVLAVSDHGTGMSPEVQALATEPFFTTKSHESGSGLGLTTVLATVERAGGTLHLESKRDVGTTATIVLPAALPPHDLDRPDVPTQVMRASPGERSGAASAGCRVLVVDDDRDMLASTVRALRFAGYSVLAAPSGAAALQLLDAGAAPAVIVSDIRMPGMSGVDLASRVREAYGVPSVLVTGGADAVDAMRSGTPVVAKPFVGNALAEAIDRALMAGAS